MKFSISLLFRYSTAYTISLLLVTNQPPYQTELYRFCILFRLLDALAALFLMKIAVQHQPWAEHQFEVY